MSMYPSLEDMKVDHMAKAQERVSRDIVNAAMAASGAPQTPTASLPYPLHPQQPVGAYPALGDYMGLEFTEQVLALNMPEYLQHHNTQVQVVPSASTAPGYGQMVAPVSDTQMGLISKVTPSNAVRQLVLCKDKDGKVGLRAKDINKGVFVCLVQRNSPAAMAGLRFGDQILEVNGVTMAGMTTDRVHSLFKKLPANGINIAVRDRPFERSITLHKDSAGHIGFQFKSGEIINIVRDSSAARNGILTQHYLLEVNGQNVVGLKDKEVTAIIHDSGPVITVTIMPSFLYKHMMKHMASSLTKIMDHSLPLL